MAIDIFRHSTFTVPENTGHRLFETIILRYSERNRPIRILDIGCGTGDHLFLLAEALPNAHFIGIDISESNILRAESWRINSPYRDRLTFQCLDYLNFKDGGFDLIISYSTLDLFPTPASQLFSKVADELVTGGILIAAMPSAGFYNWSLCMVRRIFRILESPLTNAIILWVGTRIHGKEISDEMLRERIPYMYVIPFHCFSNSLYRLFRQSCGLALLEEHSLPHASPAQLKHLIGVFQKHDQE